MTTPLTLEERVSRVETAFEFFEVVMNNMVTREEFQANMAALLASDESLRTELRTANENLRSEMQTAVAALLASDESIKAELRAEIRAAVLEERADRQAAVLEERAERQAAELRNTRWIIGAIFAAMTIGIAVIKLLP